MRIRLSVVRRLAAALIMGGLLSLHAHAAGRKTGAGGLVITDDLVGGSAGTVQASGGNFKLDGSLFQVGTSSGLQFTFPFAINEAGYFSMMTTTPVSSSFPAVSSKAVTVAWVVSNPTGTLYMIDASTASNFTGTVFSTTIYNSSYTTITGLRSNTVYNFRYKANYMEGDETEFYSLGSLATLANLPTGCAAGSGFNVAKDGYADFTTIQAAVDALPVSLIGTACVVIRDTQTYTEAITVGGFTNNGFAIKIISDPAFVSSAPVVNTPGGANPAFTINTATVTLGHITILPTSSIPYGVLANSDYVTLSSVSVGDSGTTISVAGVSLSSWSTVYRSTSQSDGSSLVLNGHNNFIYGSTIAGNSGTTGLRIAGSSNIVSQSLVTGMNGSAVRMFGGYNTISQSSVSAVGGVLSVLLIDGAGARGNTLTQNYIDNMGVGAGSAALELVNGARFNTILQSTIVANSGGRAVWINNAGSNTVTTSSLMSVSASPTIEIVNTSGNTVSYTTVTNTGGGKAFFLSTAVGNAILSSKMSASSSYAMHLFASSYNVVQQSTITAAAANALLLQSGFANLFDRVAITGVNMTPLYIFQSSSDTIRQSTITASGTASVIADLDGASSITISQCYLSGASAMGVRYGNQSNYNVLSQSSISVSGGGLPGLRTSSSSSSNTITQSFITSNNGSGVQFFGGGFNTISGSTIVSPSGNGADYGLHMLTSSSNTVVQTFISRTGASTPKGVYIEVESNGNSIVSSSITAFNEGITFYQTSSNTIVASYVQGSTAVVVFGSTGTKVSYSRLNASAGAGHTLTFSGGSNGLTLSSSTLTGGQFGIGVYSDLFNGGAIVVLNNVITSGFCSVCLTTTTAGSTVWVTSNTLSPTPSPSGGIGVLLDGLQYGATIQYNSIYFRAAGSGTSSRGMSLSSSRGLLVEHNRINQPGVLTVGNYTGVKFNDVNASEFKFNDMHSSGTVPVAYMLELYDSTVAVRNNIFMSSMTTASVTILANANSGVDFDYNNYYSSSSPVILNWGGFNHQFPWNAAVGADAHSISGNPLWAKTESGAEDFHPKSTVGRFNPATQAFVTDSLDSPTLDYADPSEPFALEPSPNNGVANLGSYGNTTEASKSPVSPCSVTRKVCKSGLCPYQTIQNAVDGLPQTLPGHSCVSIQDSAIYDEMVTVRNFTNNGSSIAISAAAGMTPKVSTTSFMFAAFRIENASVVLTGITIQPAGALTYGIFVSSPNVTISSMIIADQAGWIQTAGIRLSSWTTVSYTSVTVNDAHGFYLPGSTMTTVSYSTAINNSATKYPAYLENANINAFTVLFASNSNSGGYALWAQNSDTNTVTRSYLWSGLRSVVLDAGSDYNTISLSTVIGASSFGLWINASDWNTVAQSYMWSTANGLRLDTGSDNNSISFSTMIASTNYGLYCGGADSNTVTQSYVWGGTHGAYVDAGSDLNTISLSTIIANTNHGIWVVGSDSNTFTQNYLFGVLNGAYLDFGSEGNTVSFSTMIGSVDAGLRISAGLNVVTQSYMRGGNSGAHLETAANANTISFSTMIGSTLNGLYAATADSNTVTQSYMQGGQRGIWLNVNADDNSISLSTMIGIGAAGLYGLGGKWNTVAQSRMWGSGYGALLQTNADRNTIILSTMISNNLNLPALYILNSSTNSIQSSYIQGSTAAIVSGSTGTIIGSCVLIATNTFGTALVLSTGSVDMTVASTTLRGGPSGRGLWLNVGNSGAVSIGSVTVTGSARGLEISTQAAGFILAIDSITFRSMTAGATAIHFLGGNFSSTITLANFEDTGVGANVSGAALNPASRITMFSHYGTRTGPLYENDPNSLVGWEAGSFPGCVVTRNVGQGQRYTTISQGLAALPTTLTGHSCVVIRDAATYTSDLVLVQGFTNGGSSITIMGDPALPAHPISRLGFVIFNASVNIANIDVVPNVGLFRGIFVSSPNVTISSVNVFDPLGNYSQAGIMLSSWTTVSYTSVTVLNAYAFYLPGSTMTTVSYSSAANSSGLKQAIYLDNASSNTLTGVVATNNLAASGGAVRIANGGYNSVVQSSFSAVDGQFGLHLNLSTGNTISGSYVSAPSGYGTRIEVSNYNTISQSTTTSNLAAAAALYFTGASSNSIIGVYAANPSGYGIHLNNNSKNNTISQSTSIGGGPTPYSLYMSGVSSNTITGSFLASTALFDSTSNSNTLSFSTVTSAAGTYGLELSGADNNFITGSNLMTGAHLDGGALFNTLTGNIFTQNSFSTYALYLQTASSNTVTQSFISNPLGYALILGGGTGANNNTISQTTMTSSVAGGALFLGGNENTFIQDYIADSAGYGAQLSFANDNTFLQSTITNTSGAQASLYLSNADRNIFTQTSISNSAGDGAHLEFSDNVTFLQSTMKGTTYGIRTLQTNTGLAIRLSTAIGGSASGNAGVYMEFQTSDIAISNSYIQGSTAVWLNGAGTTTVNSSSLVGTGANGSGLWMTNSAASLTMSSNTILAGGQAGIALTGNSSGLIVLSTNTIIARTAIYGIGAAALNPSASLWITSNTIIPSLNGGATTYGISLDSLAGGATVQNNGIFYRTAGAAFNGVGAGAYGLYANASSGIRIDHNRISNPDMVTSGNYIGAAVSASPAAIFKFNDLHSTGQTLTTFNLLRITGSVNTVVRNNILVSSMTTSAAVNNRMIVVDAASVSGFSSDYNTFFSSNSVYQALWNGGPLSLLSTWVSVTGKDANSLSGNPRWFNAGVGGEDFHPLSQGGRWNGASFVNDGVNSPTIDRADPTDGAFEEVDPNGARANQGSYGQTLEASKTVLPCPITFYVRQAGDGDSLTIQGGIDSLPGALTSHSCVIIGDSGIYNENVTVQGKTFGNLTSSITIMIDPSLTVHPTVTGSFVIRNDSVNVIGIDIATATSGGTLARNYGIFASSAYITLSSINVRDPDGFILIAGVALSSYSSLSYSSITVQGAHGLRLDGKFAVVVNSTMTSNTGLFSALYIAGSDSSTVTGSLISNPGGYGAVLDSGAKYNTISLSTMTSASGSASALYILGSDYNSVTGSYMSNPSAFAVFLNGGADNNTISQSTIASAAGGLAALNVVNSDSNIVTGSMIMNLSGTAVLLDNGADNNIISLSTMTSNIGGGYALDFAGATYNTVMGCNMSNPAATSVRLNAGAAHNTISQCIVTSNSGAQALYISNADYTAVTGSFISNPGGYGAIIETGSDFNTISQSTISGGGAGNDALHINASFSNTVTGSYLSNPAGYAVRIINGSSSTLVSQSTMTSNFATFSAISIVASASNTVIRSFMSNPSGVAAQINAGSDYNTISLSTVTSNALGSSALAISASSTNIIWNSYIQGSTAVYINASTGTVINASVLVATNTSGSALALTGGSVNLAMSSNTLYSGAQGKGIYLDIGNSGAINLSTNTIHRGQYGIYAATQQAGTALWISSNTIYPAPVITADIFGIYLNGLTSGATIQNNAVYYRIPGSMGVNKTAALGAFSSAGLLVTGNRFSNPGMVLGGSIGTAYLEGTPNTIFKFNDFHSTGTSLANGFHIYLQSSPNTYVRNNIFSSSWSVTSGSGAIGVDVGSQPGFASDFNNFFSSNSLNAIAWGLGSFQFPWAATIGRDGQSVSRHPRWKNADAGVEDFHQLSQAGSWNGAAFANDGYTSGLIDAADYNESYANEQGPNGNRANLGSYGNTAEASKSPTGPTGPSVAGVFTSSISVSYGLVLANGYFVMASSDSNFGGTIFTSSTTNNLLTTLAPQGLSVNTTYFMAAAAVWGDYSAFTSTVSASTLANPPLAGAPLFNSIATHTLTVAYTNNGNPLGSTYTIVLSSGSVYPNSFSGNRQLSTTSLTAPIAGLAPNTTYFSHAAGINWASVPSAYSTLGSTATFAADPLTVISTFSNVGFSSFTVSWSANGNPLSITSYTVSLSTDGFATKSAEFSTAPVFGPTATFTGLTGNTLYTFRVQAFNHNGSGTLFATLGSTQTAPITLQPPLIAGFPEVNVSSISATWGLSLGATGYNLVASLTNNSLAVFASSAPIGINATTATVFAPALNPNTTYFLFVQAYGPGATTAFSAYPATSTLTNSPVTSVTTFTAVQATSMTVSWLANSNPINVTSYTVVLSTGVSFPNTFSDNKTLLSTMPAGASLTASITGLNDNTSYYLYVAAINHNGIASAYAALGATITQISPPASVVFDEISSNTIVASAYSPTPFFSNLNRGQSGTRVARNGTYSGFHGEQWAAASGMSTARGESAATAFNGKVYVFGGFNGVTAQNAAEVYDPAVNLWAGIALPVTIRGGHAAAVAGGKIYVVGGNTDGFTSLATNEEYDPVTGGWTSRAALSARDHLSAVAVGNAIYAFGGVTNAVPSGVNERYDPATNLWTGRAAFPSAQNQMAAASAAGPTAMLIAAAGGSGPVTDNYTYDSSLNTWSPVTVMPAPVEAAAAASLGGKVYVIGGAGAVLAAEQTVYEYDPATNLWAARTNMTTARSALSAVSAGGRIYAVGGKDGGGTALAANEEYDPGVATKFTGLLPNVQAGFKAQARNQVGTRSGETAIISTWTWAALPATDVATFTVVAADSITFQWLSNGNPAGTTEFKARASTSASFGGGATVLSSDWGAMNSTATLALSPNTTYFFQSKARNGIGGVPGIETAFVTLGSTATLAANPAIAGVTFANIATGGMSVSWLANGNPLGITTYTVVLSTEAVYPNSNSGNSIQASTKPAGALPTATLGTLAANTTYFAFASAVNWNGVRTAYVLLGSTATLALTPAQGGPTYSSVFESSVTVSWLPNGNPITVTTYTLVLSTQASYPNSNTGNKILASTTPAGAVPTASLATLLPNTTYFGFTAATNWNGAVTAYAALGGTSTLAAMPATVVSTFSAVQVTSLTVSWSANGNPISITTYTVMLSTASDFNAFATSVTFTTAPVGSPSASFNGLTGYTQYYFQARALNHNGLATAFENLGTTTTLVAPLGVPLLVGFVSVDKTSVTATWGLVSGATGYTLVASLTNNPLAIFASSTNFGIAATTAAVLAPALSPNTSYFLFVQANGPLTSSAFAAYGATSTLANTPDTLASTFSAVSITSITVRWSANGNALAITTYTVQLSTASDFNAFATSFTLTTTSVLGTSAHLTGLNGNTSYYLRVRALNHNSVASAYINLGSTLTLVSPLFPGINNLQIGDAAWRRTNSGLYQVYFQDTTGFHLDKFQVSASTTAGGLGSDVAPLTDVIIGLDPADTYNTPWGLPVSVFNALIEGVTNYITVKVFNGPPLNNFTVLQDAFYVQKDTTAPVIVDTQTGDAVARFTAGTTYTVGVNDPSSGLAAFQYSASLTPGGGATLIGWTDIAVVANTTSYTTPWAVNFPLLVSGVTNYISVRSWDVAGTTTTTPDVFYIQKDTTGPTVGITTPLNSSFNSSLNQISGTAASNFGVQGTEVSILDMFTSLYWNPVGTAFNSAAPVMIPASGTTAWTLSPGIPWVDGRTYRTVARSSTTSNIYSTTFATATFVMDRSTPTVGVLAPVPASIVAVLPVLSGTAVDPAPSPSGLAAVEVRLRRNTDDFWWNWFTQQWTPVAVSSIAAGTASWSLSPTKELRSSLDNGTSYFIAVRASDNALPSNQGDFFVSGATFTWLDTTPPSPIGNLAAVSGALPGQILLNWTAMGDDAGIGFVADGEYRIFYSTDIAAVASTATAQVVITTADVNVGDLQSYLLTGLNSGVTYYVAVALADSDVNWSLFSNIASTIATPAPINAITGHVVDISTIGITAVQVDCWNAADALVGTTFTLADGSGTYTVNGLPPGNYKLRVTWTVNGFSSSLWQDGIPMGSSNVDFFLNINYALATLTGTLSTLATSSFGAGGLGVAAVSGSYIELYQQGKEVAQVNVQPNGKWTIGGLLPGSYAVRAYTSLGYTQFQNVVLGEGEVRVLGFAVNPLPEASVFAFPNPARTSTTIRFETALSPFEAGILIFDLAGNLVKEIPDSQISRVAAPTYRATWDLDNSGGRAVASGVYNVMVTIRGGADNQTAKVIKKVAVVR